MTTSSSADRFNGSLSSMAIKAPCVAVTNAAITLLGAQTVNGVAVVAGDRVLVKDQADTTTNGIYVVRATAWARAADFDGSRDVVQGTLVVVQLDDYGVFFYQVSTANPISIGTSSITFTKHELGVGGVAYVPTVAAMVASTSLVVGQTVITQGYTTAGDGGGATYRIVAAATGTADNYIYHNLSGISGQAKRLDIPAIGQAKPLLKILEEDTGDATIVVLGDSTGNQTFEWVYVYSGLLAAKYPNFTVEYYLWNVAGEVFDAAETLQTGSGSNTLKIYNSSIAGAKPIVHLADNFAPQITDISPDLVIISHGHNCTDSNRTYYQLSSLTESILEALPDTPIILTAQNPHTDTTLMDSITGSVRELAASKGYGVLDVHNVFKLADPTYSNLYTDTVHPNATGYSIWAAYVNERIRYEADLGYSQQDSSFATKRGFDSKLKITDTSNFVTSGTGSISRDSTNFETGGESLSLSSTASTYHAYNTFVGSNDIANYKGKWVTLAVRMRNPAANDQTKRPALLQFYDGVSTVTSEAIPPSGDAWFWNVVSLKVSASATFLRYYIYPCATASASNTIQVDRISVCEGRLPAGADPVGVVEAPHYGSSLNSDPGTEEPSQWETLSGTNWGITTTATGQVGINCLSSTASNSSAIVQGTNRIPVDTSKTYRLHAWTRRVSGDRQVFLMVNFFDSDGASITGSTSGATGWPGLGTYFYWLANATTTELPVGTWVETNLSFGANGTASLPSGAKTMTIGTWMNRTDTGTTDNVIENQDIRLEEMLPASLLLVHSSEIVTATNVITASESGKTFYLNSAGGFTSTLPAPAIGLKYKFIVKTAPTTAYIIATTSAANIMQGTFLDIVGELTPITAKNTLNFVANTSLVGDSATFESDGTSWFCTSFSKADGGITVA